MTLVEVVVAMAVLSLVVLVLGAALRGFGQSAQRIDARMQRVDALRVSVEFLRDVLARVPDDSDRPPAQPSAFQADAQALEWIAVMPARFGAAGRYRFRLAVEPAAPDGPLLVLRLQPWVAGEPAADWSVADARVLAPRVERFALAYGGEGLEGDGWQPSWPADARRPPPRLKFDLVTAGVPWPAVVVPVRVASARGGARFVIGGSQ